MPHLTLEYSSNLQDRLSLDRTFQTLHQRLVDTGHFLMNDIRSRAYRAGEWRVGDGARAGSFVHLTALIMEGRDLDVQKQVSEILIDALKSECVGLTGCVVSVEVRELRKSTYQKGVL